MYRRKRDSAEEGGKYNGNFQNFIDGFGKTDLDSPYWFGVKNMKKITDQATVDLDVYYWEGNKMKHDVFNNFVILDDDYRMTYSSHWGQEGGGNIVNISFYFFSFRFCFFKNVW